MVGFWERAVMIIIDDETDGGGGGGGGRTGHSLPYDAGG